MRVWLTVPAEQAQARLQGYTVHLKAGDQLYYVDKTKLKPKADLEDTEYRAQLLSVYHDLERQPHQRAVLFTLELPLPSQLAEMHDIGDGVVLGVAAADTWLKLVAIHVTEHPGKTILDDEYEPELLWFDVSEVEDALLFAVS